MLYSVHGSGPVTLQVSGALPFVVIVSLFTPALLLEVEEIMQHHNWIASDSRVWLRPLVVGYVGSCKLP